MELSTPVDRNQQQKEAACSKEDYEVLSMRVDARYPFTERKNREAYGANRGRISIRQPLSQQKKQDRCRHIDQKQTEMYAGRCLPEQSHNQGIGGVSSRELHVVGVHIRRKSL